MKASPPPNLHAVQSSNIARIGWYGPETANPYLTELWVYFHDARRHERLYVYYYVPLDVYQALDAAPSKGRFVREFIRGKYPFDRGY